MKVIGPRVNDFDQIGTFPIRSPRYEQRRIVAKIEELFSDLDAGVAALERAKANLKRYRAAVLKAAVEGKLTEEWRASTRRGTGTQLLERILKERRRKWEADQLADYAKAGKKPPANWKDKYNEPPAPDETNLPELPEGWCWASMTKVDLSKGCSEKCSDEDQARSSTRLPYLRNINVRWWRTIWMTCRCTSYDSERDRAVSLDMAIFSFVRAANGTGCCLEGRSRMSPKHCIVCGMLPGIGRHPLSLCCSNYMRQVHGCVDAPFYREHNQASTAERGDFHALPCPLPPTRRTTADRCRSGREAFSDRSGGIPSTTAYIAPPGFAKVSSSKPSRANSFRKTRKTNRQAYCWNASQNADPPISRAKMAR